MSETHPLHVVDLIDYLNGHSILAVEQAQAVCDCTGVAYSEEVAITWRNRQDAITRYGFVTTQDAPGWGVDSLSLSYYVCRQLDIEAPGQQYQGAGSQAKANARAIAQELSKRGIA